MAILRCRLTGRLLKLSSRVSMAFPGAFPNEKLRVLWLLSDSGEYADAWLHTVNMEAVAEQYGLVCIMVEGLHSDYEDMVRGLDWAAYLTEKLPAYMQKNFPISRDPEKQLLFGTGMGGLGAVRTVLRKPESYGAAGACDTDFNVFSKDDIHRTEAFIHKMETIYGDAFASDEVRALSDPFCLAETAEKLPPVVLLSSGTANTESTEAFFKKLSACGKDVSLIPIGDRMPNARLLRETALDTFLEKVTG